MADPDFQIRGWEGGCSHPDPEMGGGGGPGLEINFFWPQFGLKLRGAGGGQALPLDPPLQSVWRVCMWIFKVLN